LAYINHSTFYKDNGRVVGYDNSHHVHHRHYMGKLSLFTLRLLTKSRSVFCSIGHRFWRVHENYHNYQALY
jgi:hypothetical protein